MPESQIIIISMHGNIMFSASPLPWIVPLLHLPATTQSLPLNSMGMINRVVWCRGALHHVTRYFLHSAHTAWSPARPWCPAMHYNTEHYSPQSIGHLLITAHNTGWNPFISLYPTFLYRVKTTVPPAQSLDTKET
jgi:hypothetical protein